MVPQPESRTLKKPDRWLNTYWYPKGTGPTQYIYNMGSDVDLSHSGKLSRSSASITCLLSPLSTMTIRTEKITLMLTQPVGVMSLAPTTSATSFRWVQCSKVSV